MLTLLVALVAGTSAPAGAVSESIAIRFCPEAKARSYPLDSLRGVQGLLLQNVAVINRGRSPIIVENVAIQLRGGAEVLDERRLASEQIRAAAKSGAAAKAQGMFEMAPFQFCDGRLLAGSTIASAETLMPGEALLLMQNVFAYRGSRSHVGITVTGKNGASNLSARGAVPIDSATSKTQFRWPLREKRPWLVGSGASFHSTHRWAVPEEFALDILAVDGMGSTFRRGGARNSDFYAYGADVVAAADGVVANAVGSVEDAPPMLRRNGESMEAYYGRLGQTQAANMAKGERGVSGNTVVIDHGNGEFSIYAHLAPQTVRVGRGDRVVAGQSLGKLGSSGNSTEPHLHFQVCDKASSLSCAGIPPTFVQTQVLNADGPRPVQSGDLVQPE